MKYFIPEWDDLVSSDYDFWHDQDLPYSKRIYAHEIYPKPNYDGLLVSRMKIEESKSKFQQIQEVGVHEYFRFKGPIFGDCGAWGYVKEKEPPFETKQIIKYYDSLGFDIGVSIDHLCLPNNSTEWHFRQELTLKNAEEFYSLHESGDYSFQAVGVAQGWDIESYRYAVEELLDIGFNFIALGGIARAQTALIIKILKGFQDLIEGKAIQIHLFGAARLEGIRAFRNLGVTSFDSASPLRNAWLGSKKNYRGLDWKGYTAIRLPFLTREKKYKDMVKEGIFTLEELEDLERSIYIMLRRFEFEKSRTPEEIVEAFQMMNQAYTEREHLSEDYLETLRERPWEKCPCAICKEAGMDVIIFRGNNRNRRRGFHNTYVFYSLLQRILHDPDFEGTKYLKLVDEKDISAPMIKELAKSGKGKKKLTYPKHQQKKLELFLDETK
ncbi:MAG: tRNA-guanine transglycosylase DpdA [Candidatus Heimdallarchaeaceae archaeon]